MEWYIKCFRQYADFSGRARRKEYWMFALFNFIFAFAIGILSVLFAVGSPEAGLGISFLSFIYAIAIFLPSLAVLVRRLHDTGKSGGWIFISFIPLIGSIWLLILLVTEGNPGDNQYGPDPKAITL